MIRQLKNSFRQLFIPVQHNHFGGLNGLRIFAEDLIKTAPTTK